VEHNNDPAAAAASADHAALRPSPAAAEDFHRDSRHGPFMKKEIPPLNGPWL
jgi:hypothetical protein